MYLSSLVFGFYLFNSGHIRIKHGIQTTMLLMYFYKIGLNLDSNFRVRFGLDIEFSYKHPCLNKPIRHYL